MQAELHTGYERKYSMSSLPKILRYSQDSEPGIRRIKRGKGFTYKSADDVSVKCDATLERIKRLGLPPAYEDVWICADEFGHLQATGLDVKGRKQYRYHTAWRDFKDNKKFDKLPSFGDYLSYLRPKIQRDLKRGDNSKLFVCAAITRLIDQGALRVGRKQYDAIGASTLRRRHIKLSDNKLKLDYKAKGGKRVRKQIKDKTLAHVLQTIDDLPGRRIFQYIGDNGELYPLDSTNVNDYIGGGFTAKTFRTWHGTLAAFEEAAKTDGEPTLKAMSETAAIRLHNTASICRSSYIHPSVIQLSEDNISKSLPDGNERGLRKSERQLLALIRQ